MSWEIIPSPRAHSIFSSSSSAEEQGIYYGEKLTILSYVPIRCTEMAPFVLDILKGPF